MSIELRTFEQSDASSETRELHISAQEALIIDACLKNGDFSDLNDFFMMLARIITKNEQDVVINVTKDELLFLRNFIIPFISIGNTNGLDIIIKIYGLLNEMELDNLFKSVGLDRKKLNTLVEIKDDNKDNTQNSTASKSDSGD
jgi:hypothetical protein